MRLLVIRSWLFAAWVLLGAASAHAGDAAPTNAPSDLITCPECAGTGTLHCRAKCDAGQVPCPRPCLKRSDAGWKPGSEVGQDPTQVWKYFPNRKGGKGGTYFPLSRLGEIIEYQDGLPVTRGVCDTCKGTTHVPCSVCKGTGTRICPICKGKKKVLTAEAEAAKAAERQKMKDATDIRLTDGRTIHGKIMMSTKDTVMIALAEGGTLEVAPELIAPQPAPAPAAKEADPVK